jgi:uncharacterized protein YecE (DUF72 family)
VYSKAKGINYLEEYAARYDTVEVDQWFWSLFDPDTVVLPKDETVAEYSASVGPDFRFTVKAPNSITLTHYYRKGRAGPLKPNPHFLSVGLLEAFLAKIEPLRSRLGMLMLQFEYLNKQKMPSQEHFLAALGEFFDNAPAGVPYALEIRNPQYLNQRHFEFLAQRGLSHVFLQGYYMPKIQSYYGGIRSRLRGDAVIRLHGYDRKTIEQKTGGDWSAIVEEVGRELPAVVQLIRDLLGRTEHTYLNVNNHYEGSAPLTIEKIVSLLEQPAD